MGGCGGHGYSGCGGGHVHERSVRLVLLGILVWRKDRRAAGVEQRQEQGEEQE